MRTATSPSDQHTLTAINPPEAHCPRSIAGSCSESWAISLDALDYLMAVADPPLLVEFAICRLAPDEKSRNQQNMAVAALFGVTRGTVENWRTTGGCSCLLALVSKTGRTFKNPRDLITVFSGFTGEDHCSHFDWSK